MDLPLSSITKDRWRRTCKKRTMTASPWLRMGSHQETVDISYCNKQTNKPTNEQTNQRDQRTDEPTNGRTNEPMNQRPNEQTNKDNPQPTGKYWKMCLNVVDVVEDIRQKNVEDPCQEAHLIMSSLLSFLGSNSTVCLAPNQEILEGASSHKETSNIFKRHQAVG